MIAQSDIRERNTRSSGRKYFFLPRKQKMLPCYPLPASFLHTQSPPAGNPHNSSRPRPNCSLSIGLFSLSTYRFLRKDIYLSIARPRTIYSSRQRVTRQHLGHLILREFLRITGNKVTIQRVHHLADIGYDVIVRSLIMFFIKHFAIISFQRLFHA